MRSISFAVAALATLGAMAAPAVAAPAAPTRIEVAMSAMGDLTPFKTIASDTLAIVDKGDLAAARTRIRDLELSWDKGEPTMKPKDQSKWNEVDKAIDAALNALRDPSPKQAQCAATLKALIAKMDAVNKA